MGFKTMFGFISRLFQRRSTIRMSPTTISYRMFPRQFHIVTMVARFTNDLCRRKSVQLIFNGVIKPTSIGRVVGRYLYVKYRQQSRTNQHAPLPRNRQMFRSTVVRCFNCQGTRFRLLILTRLFRRQSSFILIFRCFGLRDFSLLAIFLHTCFTRRQFITPIFRATIRKNCMKGKRICIIQGPNAMRTDNLSTFTSTNTSPFANMRLSRYLISIVRIMNQILYHRMFPVAKNQNKFRRVAMFRRCRVNVRRLQRLFLVAEIRNVHHAVSFHSRCNQTIRASINSSRTLHRYSNYQILVISELYSTCRVFLNVVIQFRLLSTTSSFRPFRFLLWFLYIAYGYSYRRRRRYSRT